jgi:hypothetical protein
MNRRRLVGTIVLSFGFCLGTVSAQQKKEPVQALDNVCAFPVSFGSGATYFKVCISDLGRVTDFIAPQGVDQLFPPDGAGGYYNSFYLCDGRHGTYYGDGLGDFVQSAPPSQPGGPGSLPLTIVLRTFDNLWELKHVFTWKTGELELNIAETLTNRGGSVGSVSLARAFDTSIDNDDAGDIGDRSLVAVTMRDRPAAENSTGNMLTLTALNKNTPLTTSVTPYSAGDGCNPGTYPTPSGPSDLMFNVTYNAGSFTAGAKKTMKFQLRRQ